MGASISGITSFASSHISSDSSELDSDKVELACDLLSTKLPRELSLYILDLAEYWVVQSVESRRAVTVNAGPSGELQTASILSAPIKRLDGGTKKPIRRITITTLSHDQGWSDQREHHGMRGPTSSFFEAALVRPYTSPPPSNTSSSSLDSPAPAPGSSTGPTSGPTSSPPRSPPPNAQAYRIIPHTRTRLHSNIHASVTAASFSSVLLAGESPIVDEAQPGDRVVAFATAQYPGWRNFVTKCEIKVEVMPI